MLREKEKKFGYRHLILFPQWSQNAFFSGSFESKDCLLNGLLFTKQQNFKLIQIWSVCSGNIFLIFFNLSLVEFKTFTEKEKMLVTSIFSVLYAGRVILHYFICGAILFLNYFSKF